jgi:hypothetical protein
VAEGADIDVEVSDDITPDSAGVRLRPPTFLPPHE